MSGFLYFATIYLAAAVVAVPLASRLGLGSVLGYLLAGIVIGPLLGLVGGQADDLRTYAEFGVVMMLFLIGLELEPRALWEMRDKLLGLGGLQIGITMLVVMGASMTIGVAPGPALAIGMILALSSTAIVLQTLTEKGLMKTPGGRSTFSVLLTQDVAVIPMLALMPLLIVPNPGEGEAGLLLWGAAHAAGVADGGMSLVDGLPGWQVTLVTLAAIAAVVAGGMYLTRPLFRFIHMARLREIQTATALLIVIAIALLMTLVGLSPALGAFLAGVVLASSEFRHELEANIEPFKGLLLGLFFITVGAGIDFAVMGQNLGLVAGLTLAMMVAKGAILYALAVAFRIRGRDRWLFTLGLAQAGEFGFVLISFALQQAVFPGEVGQILLLVVALSMLLTPLAFIAYDRLPPRIADHHSARDAREDPDEIDDWGPVIIAGIGRFGQVVNRMVQMAGVRTVVLDHDLSTIELMRRFGFKGFFGDPTRPELLHAAGLAEARVLVVALDDKKAAIRLVEYARAERPDLHIVARAHDRVHVYELYRAGADDIVREMFDASLRAGRYVLENMEFSLFEASEMEKTFYRHDRRALRELADLWQPGVPVAANEAYIRRARELNTEFETELVRQFDDPEQGPGAAGGEASEAALAYTTRTPPSGRGA
ncbi:MAG: cation:proton antiporter [Paracoccaceae bacterium]|jgi:CPA2 family monovalent cation:H+ antiporter-2|nr:cation:proton antiporter [Paracoccaceae bacterium]